MRRHVVAYAAGRGGTGQDAAGRGGMWRHVEACGGMWGACGIGMWWYAAGRGGMWRYVAVCGAMWRDAAGCDGGDDLPLSECGSVLTEGRYG